MSQENQLKAGNNCETSEAATNQKGDSIIERETIQRDSLNYIVGEENHNTQSNRNENSSQSFENQSGCQATVTGSHGSENLTEVKSSLFDFNQSSGNAQKLQSKSEFCEYVQNVQALAESSYIRYRNTSKTHTDKLQKLESPKLKRPIDRVNTNVAKKRTESLVSSNVGRGVSTAVNDKHKKVSPCDQSGLPSTSIGNVTDDTCNDEISEKPESSGITDLNHFNSVTNEGMNILEDTGGNSVETFEERLNNAAGLNKRETESSCATRNVKILQEGFDVSCFVEMFSNSVMGNIMSDAGKAGSLRFRGKPGNEKVNTENYKTSVETQYEKDSGRIVIKDVGKNDGTIKQDSKTSTQASCVDEILGPTNIEGESDDSREVCKFQELGDLVRDIGDSAECHRQSAEIVKICHNSASSEAGMFGSCDSGSHLQTSGTGSDSFAEVLDKDKSEIADENTKKVDDDRDIEVTDKSVSTFINGRFKLDYHETQDIMNQGNINRLPITVLVHILKNLTAFQLLRRASCVCKYWYNLCRDPDIWRSICLVNQHRLSDFDFKRILQFSDFRVRFLNLTDSRFVTNHGIKYLIMSCPLLEELRVMR